MINNPSKPNKIYHNFIGIDISKYDFVVAVFANNKTKSFPNNQTGWQDFIKDYASLLAQSLVVLEITGGYEMGLMLYLQQRGINVHRADTRKVKNFIRSLGMLGKTDSIDALGIARYGYERHQDLVIFCPNSVLQEELKLLEERRLDLVKLLIQEKNRLQAPNSGLLSRSYQNIIDSINKEIAVIDEQIKDIIDNDDNYTKKKEILMTIEGIGPKTANALIALVPELGKIDNKKIASLCGLAPYPKQSGTKTYYARTIGGRRNLRPLLFMAAMGASRTKTRLGVFYNNLIVRGKKNMVAQTALMRKIIVIANSRLRDFYACL